MCIGIPMKVISVEGTHAWCEGRGEREQLDMLIVGEQPVGAWVLAFRGAAREVLDEVSAAQTNAALDALAAALRGEQSFDRYFADLVDREPQLPEHLRPAPK